MLSYIKVGVQAKDIGEQIPDGKYLCSRGVKIGNGESSNEELHTFTVHFI